MSEESNDSIIGGDLYSEEGEEELEEDLDDSELEELARQEQADKADFEDQQAGDDEDGDKPMKKKGPKLGKRPRKEIEVEYEYEREDRPTKRAEKMAMQGKASKRARADGAQSGQKA